jgi:radical SAM superfamily enzyme YgiQ (UPF0313 family)
LAKKILLFNPWITDFTAYDFWLKPLALLQLSAWLKHCPDLAVFFIDCLDRFHPEVKKSRTRKDGRGPYPKQEIPKPEPLKDIPRKYSRYGLPVSTVRQQLSAIPVPDVVMISGLMTYWYPGVQTAVELIREKFGPVPIILGGTYPSLVPWHAGRFSGADIVMEGHWENQLRAILIDIMGNWPASSLESGWDLFSSTADYSLLSNKVSLPMMTSRGCPFRCSFCAGPILNPLFRQAKPEWVLRDIKKMISIYGVRHITFYDDALLIHKEEHLYPVLRGVIDEELPVAFHSPNGLHVKEIDRKTAFLLKESGFKTLFLSQESTSARFLDRSSPKVSPGDLQEALTGLESAGYKRNDIHVYLMVGLPDQKYDEVRQSILDVRSLGARPSLSQYSPVPGTKDWRRMCESGRLHDRSDPLFHNKVAVQYLGNGLTPRDYDSLKLLSLEDRNVSLELVETKVNE